MLWETRGGNKEFWVGSQRRLHRSGDVWEKSVRRKNFSLDGQEELKFRRKKWVNSERCERTCSQRNVAVSCFIVAFNRLLFWEEKERIRSLFPICDIWLTAAQVIFYKEKLNVQSTVKTFKDCPVSSNRRRSYLVSKHSFQFFFLQLLWD